MFTETHVVRSHKILFAVWLLLVGARESFSMWRQTGEGWHALGFFVIMVFLCGLVVRSAFRRADPVQLPNKGWRTFWTVMAVLSVLGICGTILEMLKPREFKHVVTVNGMAIPLDDCIVGSKDILPDEKERVTLCTCLAYQLGSNTALAKDQRARLERGNMGSVVEDAMKTEGPLKAAIAGCFELKSLVVTDEMAQSARAQCIAQMQADTAYRRYDVKKYCDCAMKQVIAAGRINVADSTDMRARVEAACLEQSKK